MKDFFVPKDLLLFSNSMVMNSDFSVRGFSGGLSEAMAALTATVCKLWTPAEITTALWLDAADASTVSVDGSAVTQWADKSGNSRHVSQSTQTNQPSVASDPSRVVFDGSNDRLVSTGFDFPRPFSVFFVGSSLGASYRRAIHVGISSDASAFIGSVDDSYATFFGNGSSTWEGVGANSPTVSVSSPRIFCVTNAGSGASDAIPYTNGAAQIAKGGGTFSGTGKGVSIGGYSGATGQEWAGPIYEVLILPRVCDLAERQIIEGSLAHKWDALFGVTTLVDGLPLGHPYKSAPPML